MFPVISVEARLKGGVWRMEPPTTVDAEIGPLRWNSKLEWWEGSVKLESSEPFTLYVLSRHSPDRQITPEARRAFQRLLQLEAGCRRYAAVELVQIRNEEWSDSDPISEPEFARRLIPDSIEIHENGYAEFHFKDDDLFWGHGVGVRIEPDGDFQEAVVQG
jgi:hypothetical protein